MHRSAQDALFLASMAVLGCSSSDAEPDRCEAYSALEAGRGYWYDVSGSPTLTKREILVDLLGRLKTIIDIEQAETAGMCGARATRLFASAAIDESLPEPPAQTNVGGSGVEQECAKYRSAVGQFRAWRNADTIAYALTEAPVCERSQPGAAREQERCEARDPKPGKPATREACARIASALAGFFPVCPLHRYAQRSAVSGTDVWSEHARYLTDSLQEDLEEAATRRAKLTMRREALGALTGHTGDYFPSKADRRCRVLADQEIARALEDIETLIAEIDKIEALLTGPSH